jgi:shikimate kinase
MGAGKTTIGKALARRVGWRFVDSDQEIEQRTGVRIPVIFEIEGEAGFRTRESRVLSELLQEPRIVVATGGGAVLAESNREAMREHGTVCYLKAHPKTLFQRTRNDKNRPLLQVADPLKALEDLLAQRAPHYEAVADHIIDVDRCTSGQIVDRLAKLELFS